MDGKASDVNRGEENLEQVAAKITETSATDVAKESEIPGFFLIPGFARYAISKSGVILNRATLKIKKWSVVPKSHPTIKGGYVATAAIRDNGKRTNLSRHRAIMMAFVKADRSYEELTVNHKNGIPGDDHMDNLEWMTRAENIKHANENNLYPNRKKTPVLVMNVATGGVIRYSKLAECSKAHGITDSTVYKRATRAAGRIFDGFAFKLDDGSLWNVRTLTADRGREILAKNIFDDSISIFDDCNQASQILGINRGSIKLKAREKSNTPIRGFLFRKLKDSKDWPKLSQWHLELCKKKPEKVSLGWVVKDTVSGKESALFTSEVGDLLGFPENNIIRELRKGISPCLRYTFRPIEFV